MLRRLCALTLLIPLAAVAQAPALPPGLADEPAAAEAPALPPGLGAATGEGAGPALPPGLGEDSAVAPALPPGLEDSEAEAAETQSTPPATARRLNLHGFWETQFGPRLQNDPAQDKSYTLGETRLQLESDHHWNWGDLEITADTYYDAVLDEAEFDLRQLRVTWSPLPNLDLRIGRQVLTWGTGDLLFINDLFPKDWQSFLSGRDVEYLKAPGDAIKVGWFTDLINAEFVYTPQFDHDRFITGERVSYWNPMFRRWAGAEQEVNYNAPSDWFTDDEFALRLYRNLGSYEIALYGYAGFWKSPGGQRIIPMQATFPRLRVFGASVRGNFLGGIGNAEIGYYDSYDDPDGEDAFINNSEFRLMLGYERELGKEFTGGFQYYLEHMMDYDAYRESQPFFIPARDEDRHLFSVRLTKLLMNQDLNLSLFAFYSPSDSDAYLRPKVAYKINDDWDVEAGMNLFFGRHNYTFFGQFENNSNIYASLRWSF